MAHDQGQVTPGPESFMSLEDLKLQLVGPASAPCLQRRKERSPWQGSEERPGEEVEVRD